MDDTNGTDLSDVTYGLSQARSDGGLLGQLPQALDPQAPFRRTQNAPLLRTDDGIGPSMDDMWKSFEDGNRGSVLTNSDQQGVSNFAYPNDLLQQKMAGDEVKSLAETYSSAGSIAPGKKGGLMSGRSNTVVTGNSRKRPENIGNPRVGEQALGVIPDGASPAESEAALRKQITESIRTEPSTRLDQSVAIPELYQQVNPVAKLGFPIMQTRPQFQEDFVRGRLALPKDLTIDPSPAYTTSTDAYAHVGSLDQLRAVYGREFKGDVPTTPAAFAGKAPAAAPPAFDATFFRDTRNPKAPNSAVPEVAPDKLAPLMYGGKVAPLPDSFRKGSGPGEWPLSGNGYRVDGVPARGGSGGFGSFATVDSVMG